MAPDRSSSDSLSREAREGGASTSANVPVPSGSSGSSSPGGSISSAPALGKCCYGLLVYSRKHYDAGHEPSCIGVKASSAQMNPPRGEQGEAWGNFRYSCLGYSVFRATSGHKDGGVHLPSCEFGVEVLASSTGKDEKQQAPAATAAREAVEKKPEREALPPQWQRGPSPPPKRAPSPSALPISVSDDFPQRWLNVSKKMLVKMGKNLEYSRKAVATAISGKWNDSGRGGGGGARRQ